MVGAVIPYPYPFPITISTTAGGAVVVTPAQRRRRELISQFAPHHFGLATGFQVRTEAGLGLYVTSMPTAPALVIPGLLETWWYPKPLFLVFAAPAPDEELHFNPGDELALLIPTPATRTNVVGMDPEEVMRIQEESRAYDDYLTRHGELRWTSAEGHGFARLYRLMSHVNRNGPIRPEEGNYGGSE